MAPFVFIAGPCVIEDEGLVMEVAQELKLQLHSLPIEFYFKSSFDKANRTSIDGFRGPGQRIKNPQSSQRKNRTCLVN